MSSNDSSSKLTIPQGDGWDSVPPDALMTEGIHGGKDPMSGWRTYRNGNPREIWNLERLARHRAAKLGYRVHRSRRRKGRDNAGEFMLLHKKSSTVLLGSGFTATLEMILKFLEQESGCQELTASFH